MSGEGGNIFRDASVSILSPWYFGINNNIFVYNTSWEFTQSVINQRSRAQHWVPMGFGWAWVQYYVHGRAWVGVGAILFFMGGHGL